MSSSNGATSEATTSGDTTTPSADTAAIQDNSNNNNNDHKTNNDNLSSKPVATAATTHLSHANQDDPVPSFQQLDLSLSRDQGTHHLGSGAGSEAHTLSEAAHSHHGRVAQRILSQTSVGKGGALDPDNLPKAPKELPLPTVEAGNISSLSSNGGQNTPVSTPGATPAAAPSSIVATPGESRVGTPANDTTRLQPSSAATNNTTTNMAPPPNPTYPTKPPLKEKKSVFGKLFGQGGNASTNSLHSNNATSNHYVGGATSTATTTGHHSPSSGGYLTPNGGERMERGGSNDTSGSGSVGLVNGMAVGAKQTGGGASIVRRTSKKEQDKQDKKEQKEQLKREKQEQKEREREEHLQQQQQQRPRSSSHGQSKDQGLGQALNEFMRNKVQRKSSQTSRKSDDGRSEHAVESAYGGSTKGGDDNKSRAGQSTTPSLTKKYGVCDKVIVGKGATAVVRLAHKWDRTSEKLYAVKEFRKRRKNETEKEYVKKLTSEFCISSTLHHHNIVETVDLVQDEQHHWCEVMEYCPGGDLYAAIKKGEMTPLEINSYFKQILAGVSYLHSMGVAHRDIKPENLLLDAKGHVKITDFGVSDVFRMCWEKTTHLSKGLCGSEPYIAPEQFEQKEYDARLVDVWACAVVFYCMHFQELPWRVAKPSDPSFGPYLQLYNETSAPAPISNLVPRECRNVIKRMLDPDPKTRATTEWILQDHWFQSIKVVPELEGILPLSTETIKPLNGSTTASSTAPQPSPNTLVA
ncbi:hypothetical protein OIO90_005818 [Microbotryomycetes sp. JL221]|nr:hypothetical protein OIO90_005818 [Microbotryomycetes sp. JL221]